ncbi:MAG: ATP-binding protein [Deltaproteobacteria bacterium]|nr:ATP-binding protein [Deltaproteobacteria bacterium]
MSPEDSGLVWQPGLVVQASKAPYLTWLRNGRKSNVPVPSWLPSLILTFSARDSALFYIHRWRCFVSSVICSACCDGTSCSLIQVESNFLKGFTGVQLVGQISDVCRGGLERAKAALENIGIPVPQRRIIMSLAPADYRKDGSQLDLAFAINLALLISGESGRSTAIPVSRWLFASELSLDGQLRPTRNMISFAIEAATSGMEGMVVSPDSAADLTRMIRHASGPLRTLRILSFRNLREVLTWIFQDSIQDIQAESIEDPPVQTKSRPLSPEPERTDFDDMILNPELEQIAKVVATGLHSLILYGCPGTGKSMFAERIPSLFPRLNPEIHLETLRIHSAAESRIPESLLDGRPPYRAPHHHASPAAVIGVPDAPGETALAHGGLLFLDELPEFRRDILEALREPLETGELRVSRARSKVIWKADMTLVAACNLCPCGWYSSEKRRCSCPTVKILAYRRKLSGPVMDRIDLHINLPEYSGDLRAPFLREERQSGKTIRMQEDVQAARELSHKRNQKFGILYNKHLRATDLAEASGICKETLQDMLDKLTHRGASQRSLIRTVRIARSLADLRLDAVVSGEDIRQAWAWQADVAARQRGDEVLGLI